MTIQSFTIAPELPPHASEINQITFEIFGPGMFARAAYKLREGVMPETHLSFVAQKGGRIIGSVRQTRILIGEKPALLLGPLGVLPTHKNSGIGRSLMKTAVSAAKEACDTGGAKIILLVGDYDYYAPFGFVRASQEQIIMPRPVDIGRVLACELQNGSLAATGGEARRWM